MSTGNTALNGKAQRLFFALWPDASLQKALYRVGQRLHQVFGGRLVKTDNIHLTLAFLGYVPVDRIDELRAIGESIEARPFTLELSRFGCWKRAAVGWVGPGDDAPGELVELVLQLRQRLLAAAFSVDDRPFAAHVTVLRKARCRPNDDNGIEALAWPVSNLCLMRSETLQAGPVYTEIGRWPLEGDGRG